MTDRLPVLTALRAGSLALLAMLNLAQADVLPPSVPDPVQKPPPHYPQAAYDANIEGFVRLQIVIAPDGKVIDATVLKAEPLGWFEEAALEAVKQWHYRPTGRQITAYVQIDFKIHP